LELAGREGRRRREEGRRKEEGVHGE